MERFVNVARHGKRCQETEKNPKTYNCLLRNQQQKKKKRRGKTQTQLNLVDSKKLGLFIHVNIYHQHCDKVLVLHSLCLLQIVGLQEAEDVFLKTQLFACELKTLTVEQGMLYIFKKKKITWNIALAKMKVFLVNLSCHLPKLSLARLPL